MLDQYGCMLVQETTLYNVIQVNSTIPFILPGEIPLPKLPLSQTFTNTTLTQPHFSPSVFLSQAFISNGTDAEWSGPCRRSVLENDIWEELLCLITYGVISATGA